MKYINGFRVKSGYKFTPADEKLHYLNFVQSKDYHKYKIKHLNGISFIQNQLVFTRTMNVNLIYLSWIAFYTFSIEAFMKFSCVLMFFPIFSFQEAI